MIFVVSINCWYHLLAKLKRGSISTQLYSESAATLEKLAIFKAWAQVYIVAMEQHIQQQNEKSNVSVVSEMLPYRAKNQSWSNALALFCKILYTVHCRWR